MRYEPAGLLDALRGSSADISMQFNIWYDGAVIFPDVDVQKWSVQWDATRQVMGQGNFEILDPEGSMIPWGYDDPLNVGGGMVQTKLICGSSSLDLGFQRITQSEPAEKWKLYQPGGKKLWVNGTHTINVQADDQTTVVASDRFLVPETAPKNATVFSELSRITSNDIDVIIDSALTDRSVPASVVYKDDRMATVQQLADAIGAGLRVTGGGQLMVYAKSSASVWTVQGGDHDANLIGAQRRTQYGTLYNGVVSTNTLQNGQVLIGTAFQTGGPLAWEGPHGRVPYFHQASFATTPGAINQDAQTMLGNIIGARSSSIPFTAILNPLIETGDTVTLMMPIYDGSEAPMVGTISAVGIGGTGSVDPTMTFTADVQDTTIQAISLANRGHKWLAQ